MSGENTPGPQTWIEKDKRITVTTCGNIQTYTEVCLKTGRVTTKTFVKT
jgi:hypothetical protein